MWFHDLASGRTGRLWRTLLLCLGAGSVASAQEGRLFLESLSIPTLLSTNLSGVDRMPLLSDTGSISHAIDPVLCHVYFIREGKLQRMNFNGTGLQTVVDFAAEPLDVFPNHLSLDLVQRKAYVASPSTANRIVACNLDGSDLSVIVNESAAFPPVTPSSLDVDTVAGKICWYDGMALGFRSCNQDGTNIESVRFAGLFTTAVDLDPAEGMIYWLQGSSLLRGSIDGAGATETVMTYSGTVNQGSLAVDRSLNRIYFASGTELVHVPLDDPSAAPTISSTGIAGLITDIVILPTQEVVLRSEPEVVAPSEAFSVRICGAEPGRRFLLALPGVGGSFTPLMLAPGDAEGRGELVGVAPPVSPMLSVDLVALAFSPTHRLVFTNEVTVTFP